MTKIFKATTESLKMTKIYKKISMNKAKKSKKSKRLKNISSTIKNIRIIELSCYKNIKFSFKRKVPLTKI